jgi:integrase
LWCGPDELLRLHVRASRLGGWQSDRDVVSRRLGHANEALTARIYAHVLPQQGADAAARFAEIIDAAETGEDDEKKEA